MSLARIAARLGLSVTTVSRALGGFRDVAAETRMRVEAEAQRISYRPNQAARRLRQGRSFAVGVVLPAGPGQFDDPFFMRMLAAIGPALEQAGLDLLVTCARPGSEELRAYRNLVSGRRVDGILLARTRRRDERIAFLLDAGFPFVAHGRSEAQRPFAFVDVDGAGACAAATARLIGFGHRRIGLINAPEEFMFAHYRAQGFRAAMGEAGLTGVELHAEATEENGFLAMRRLLADAAPTAVVCATDRLAVGALHALADAGKRAGRDVSVIGYDDLPMAAWTDPKLTTVVQPIERAARRMVAMLLHLLAGGDCAGMQEVWPAELVARASDGPAPEQRRDNAASYHRGETPDAPKDSVRA